MRRSGQINRDGALFHCLWYSFFVVYFGSQERFMPSFLKTPSSDWARMTWPAGRSSAPTRWTRAMELWLHNRFSLTIFRTMFNPIKTSPDRHGLAADFPLPPAIGASAFTTDQDFRQSVLSAVLALLCDCLICNLPFTVPTGHLHLYQFECFFVYNRRMIVGYQILCHFTAVFYNFLCNAVLGEGFLQKHITGNSVLSSNLWAAYPVRCVRDRMLFLEAFFYEMPYMYLINLMNRWICAYFISPSYNLKSSDFGVTFIIIRFNDV